MKIKILLTLIMLWSVLVVTAQTTPPVPGEGSTDCAAITTGVGGPGDAGSGTGTGAGTAPAPGVHH